MTHSKTLWVLIFATFFLPACNPGPPTVYTIPGLDSTITAKKISLTKLARSYNSLHGQFIETEGTFYYAFEQFAISDERDPITQYSNEFWLDPNMNLKMDYNLLDKMDGKHLRVKGMIDTSGRGHLGQYLATIKRIYFFEVR